MLKIPQEWQIQGLGFLPLCLHAERAYSFLRFRPLFWVARINFAGRSLYNISLAFPYLVAFPSTFSRSCLTHIFSSILFLSLPSSLKEYSPFLYQHNPSPFLDKEDCIILENIWHSGCAYVLLTHQYAQRFCCCVMSGACINQ